MKYKGFTLIELLIVVVILALLAATALPNLLQAQTRAKVARVRGDMRSLATAIEAYAADNSIYPWTDNTFAPLGDRFRLLTTPIAYITSVPLDPFPRRRGTYLGEGSEKDPTGRWYLYNTANNLVGFGNPDSASENRWGWSLTSGGPDCEIEFPYYPFAEIFVISREHLKFIYDPTNGTVSGGEIFRRGGNLRRSIPEIDHP